MKKYFLMAILFTMIFSFYDKDVSAAVTLKDENLLSGVIFKSIPTNSNKPIDSSIAWTDGDLNTSAFMSGNPHNRYVTTFAKPMDITSFTVNFNGVLKYTGFRITFINKGNVTKIIESSSLDKDQTFNVNLKEIVSFGITNIYLGGTFFNISEMELLGHITPNNTDASLFFIRNLHVGLQTIKSLSLSWDPVVSPFFDSYNIYLNDVLINNVNGNSAIIDNLVPGTTYKVSVSAVDIFGTSFSTSTIFFTIPPLDTSAPLDPTGIRVTAGKNEASVIWNVNIEKDLDGYFIYLDGLKINSTPLKLNKIDLSALIEDTDYKLEISAIDLSGNESGKTLLDFRTLSNLPVPDIPILNGSGYNMGALLNWPSVKYATKYIIYQDGVKIGETTKNFIKINNLVNGRVYKFQVSSFNLSGVSALSSVINISPDKNKAPPINLGINLLDLSKSTSNWFQSIWLIIAFVVAIGVAFRLGKDIKTLF